MREEGGEEAAFTHICGFLLSQLQFLLGIFKSLGIFVELILSALEFLLQCKEVILKLRVFEWVIDSSEEREAECARSVVAEKETERKKS